MGWTRTNPRAVGGLRGTRTLTTKEFCVSNTLVVPLDGSALAERALPYAVRLAAQRGGRQVLMRAALAPPPSGLDWERQQVAAVDEATAYLAAVAQKIATRVPVTSTLVYGHAPEAILDTVQQFWRRQHRYGYPRSNWLIAPAAWQRRRSNSDAQSRAGVHGIRSTR